MNYLERSICSTCRYISDCVLTTDKSTISSCSEYVHQLEKEFDLLPTGPCEKFIGNNYEQIETVLH